MVIYMINFIKKHKDYFLTIGISLLILILVFIIKGIYPFGNNSLIYSDMYDQITSYYYYFYDAIRGGTNSLFMNFHAANGVNFFGIIAYYLLNPFSLLILLVERSKIYLFMSVIIALKMILCNITCLYMIKKLFKKINIPLAIILAISYGFSSYGLNYYLITSWIDVMYMFPLIIVGLKKLFDTNDFKMYFITLTLAICFNFYLTFSGIIFIFLLALPYVLTYVKKEEFGKKILALGIGTILSIASSIVIVLPAYKQVSISARLIATLETLVNSKLGPITDKIALLTFTPIAIMAILLLLKDYKQHKKFLKFYIPSMILFLIPFIVEPVNKLLHFGSYASFPCRFSFITTLFVIIGGCYFFNNYKAKKSIIPNFKKYISILITVITSLLLIVITKLKYNDFQQAIDDLTLSRNKTLIIFLFGMLGITLITHLLIYILNKGLSKLAITLISVLSIIFITCNTYTYVGVEFVQEGVNNVYKDLTDIYNNKLNKDYFKYKNVTDTIINNSSNVTTIPTMDHFSSMADGNTQKNLKLLGYTQYWSQIFSEGGTMFTDILLGHKYLINLGEDAYGYTLKKQYNDLYWHEFDKDISYGYLVNQDVDLEDYNNTFEIQNAIYNSITNKKDLFKVYDPININNIEVKDNIYTLKDKNSYIEFNVKIKKESKLYLELYNSLDVLVNSEINKQFEIHVNDEVFIKEFPTNGNNGIIDFGVYKDETVNIKIYFKEDCELKSLTLGSMDINKLNDFIDNYKIDYDIEFINNKINININSDEEKILFIPISHNDSYTAYNNNEKVELIKVYDNYIGIKLNSGENNITIKFVPAYLKISFIISLAFLILAIILMKTSLYKKLLECKFLQKAAAICYTLAYALVILMVYLLPTIAFFISFIIYIRI